jgi:hypothetical protein
MHILVGTFPHRLNLNFLDQRDPTSADLAAWNPEWLRPDWIELGGRHIGNLGAVFENQHVGHKGCIFG